MHPRKNGGDDPAGGVPTVGTGRRLPEFILANTERILEAWEKFAETVRPPMANEDRSMLQDHARAMLVAIAETIGSPQTASEQNENSKGRSDNPQEALVRAAEAHAGQRADFGFSIGALMAEYRALRVNIVRLWGEAGGAKDSLAFDDLIRFHEAMDQLISNAVVRYTSQVQHSKDIFLAILGHDLRSPLGAILMSANFLRRATSLDSQYTKAASRIFESGRRMKQMIEDLVDFTRTRLGKGIPITPIPNNLTDLCQQVVDEMCAFHPDRAILFEAPDDDVNGLWDEARIKQVLSNLLGNALQYGSEKVPVIVTLRAEPDQVLLAVHNDGKEIAPADIPHLFEPLVRGAKEEAPTGHGQSASLGLGLYIVREIVSAHGGTITVESSPNDGTTFTVRLPRR